jgi:hypothetical protein
MAATCDYCSARFYRWLRGHAMCAYHFGYYSRRWQVRP